MQAFSMSDLEADRARRGILYHEFLRVPSMSCGVYGVPAGGSDPQTPHAEDEVYYVVRGRGRIRVGSEDREVLGGSIVFVPAAEDHRFHDVVEDLVILVFFAPAEGTVAP